jgi:phospholipid transport system substrate-binding protein
MMKHALLVSCAVLGVSLLTPSAFAAGLPGTGAGDGGLMVRVADAPAKPDAAKPGANKAAEAFITKLADQGIGFLGDASMSDDARRAEFKKLLNGSFDMQTIARFSLGRYWKTASDAQRQEYMDLFRKMIVDVYSARFSDYKGQNLVVRGSRPEGQSDILVNSAILQPSGPEVAVDWRVRKKDGVYKVVDVIVEGVSMAVTQRSDFASVIQRGGGDLNVLLTHLKSPEQK